MILSLSNFKIIDLVAFQKQCFPVGILSRFFSNAVGFLPESNSLKRLPNGFVKAFTDAGRLFAFV